MAGIVITGGPGTGKTTLLEKMKEHDYKVVPEAAREFLSGKGERRKKILARDQLVMARNIHRIQQEQHKTVTDRHLLDRSPIDPIAYIEADEKKPTRGTLRVAKAYDPEMVFLLAPLKNYKKDATRKEDETTAKKIHDRIRQVYARLGHKIIDVPDFSAPGMEETEAVAKRAEFVKRKIEERK